MIFGKQKFFLDRMILLDRFAGPLFIDFSDLGLGPFNHSNVNLQSHPPCVWVDFVICPNLLCNQ
uniref:Uncharacterized protein n=1 Tax=Rhizophora mucronata TaxID=61149 RepID=A0A2P2J1G3_RHIMU